VGRSSEYACERQKSRVTVYRSAAVRFDSRRYIRLAIREIPSCLLLLLLLLLRTNTRLYKHASTCILLTDATIGRRPALFFFGIKSKNCAKNTSFSFPYRRQRIASARCTLYNPRQYNNSVGNRESGSWPRSQHTPAMVHCIITFLPGLFQTEFAWHLSRGDYTTLHDFGHYTSV